MLKTLKPETYAGIANVKCGEVYFQSLNSYRIDCAFCDLKSFVFGDFLLHIQNVHFENGLLKTETLLPKQEQRDTPPPPPPSMMPLSEEPVNPFAWCALQYEDNNADVDVDIGNGNGNAASDDNDDEKDEKEEESAIMKWDNERVATRRHRHSTKPDYNEDSDNGSSVFASDCNAATDAKKTTQLACAQCSKMYRSQKTLRRHVQRQHAMAMADDDSDDMDMDNAEYKPTESKSPLAEASSQEYSCEKCGKVYQGKYTLRQHMKRDHEGEGEREGIFACLECNLQLPRLRQLDAHMVTAHGGFACVVCDHRYKSRHELKRHQLRHTSERNVSCVHVGCGKRFFTMRHMRSHMKVHSEQKNFVCESCGYSCRNKETLRVHIRSHTGERPFACQVCGKSFPSHSGLREHMAMHSTERPHVCNVCGATFARQKGLYHHKFLHSATKQFVCKLCGNAYAQAAGLAGHMRKHRNDELEAP